MDTVRVRLVLVVAGVESFCSFCIVNVDCILTWFLIYISRDFESLGESKSVIVFLSIYAEVLNVALLSVCLKHPTLDNETARIERR